MKATTTTTVQVAVERDELLSLLKQQGIALPVGGEVINVTSQPHRTDPQAVLVTVKAETEQS